jgi:leucyl aminopeptidase
MIQIGFNNKYLKLIVVDEAVLETSELLDTDIRAKVVALNKNGLKLIPLLDDIHALVCVTNIEEKDKKFETLEKFRLLGNKVFKKLAEFKLSEINIAFDGIEKNLAFAFIEGLLLSTYTFKKYKKEDKKSYEFSKIYVSDEIINRE